MSTNSIDGEDWRCSKCCWRNPDTKKCHLNPPDVVLSDGNYVSVRPSVEDDDCCSHWKLALKKITKPTLKEWISDNLSDLPEK